MKKRPERPSTLLVRLDAISAILVRIRPLRARTNMPAGAGTVNAVVHEFALEVVASVHNFERGVDEWWITSTPQARARRPRDAQVLDRRVRYTMLCA
jgi:hypothetical protein